MPRVPVALVEVIERHGPPSAYTVFPLWCHPAHCSIVQRKKMQPPESIGISTTQSSLCRSESPCAGRSQRQFMRNESGCGVTRSRLHRGRDHARLSRSMAHRFRGPAILVLEAPPTTRTTVRRWPCNHDFSCQGRTTRFPRFLQNLSECVPRGSAANVIRHARNLRCSIRERS